MRRTSRGPRPVAVGAALVALLAIGVLVFIVIGRGQDDKGQFADSEQAGSPTATKPADWLFDRASNPARTIVHDRAGEQLAVFTDGARTVDITGPSRTFREPKFTRASVTVDVWVRLAPHEWRGGAERDSWFAAWFSHELSDTSPDALGIAFQYIYGAPDLYNAKGVRYAGDAQFGPFSSTDPDGRAENNDFYDYLGIDYTFPDGKTREANKARYGDVDCSGFLRLIYGYRMSYPMRETNTPGPGLPRRAFAMSRYAGVQVLTGQGESARNYAALQPGDLVFFNVDPTDGPQADHSGMFLGVDEAGHYRFISSRTLANGPTMGDSKFQAVIDGDGHFALTLVNSRRL